MTRRGTARLRFIVLAVALAVVTQAAAQAAEVRVFSGGAAQETLRALAPEFEKRTGHRLSFTFAHVSIIQKKLAAGEQADVVLLPVPLMAAVDKTIGLRPEGRAVLARIGIGVVVREGAKRPDISTVDAVRRMLLEARAIAVPQPDGLTGSHLMRMMAKLGVADVVRPKLRHKPAIDGGGELVATGEAEIGLYLASEIRTVKGTALIGLLPAELQNYIVYSIALPARNAAPEPALAFVKFVSDPASRERWKISGFELIEAGN
ncbi:MAG: substrate-binding domain-containing protein [Hyphomicrobiales bacterium]|nr:substrate-binding domain-containing protein [Hyphomicrobiales bacterium]